MSTKAQRKRRRSKEEAREAERRLARSLIDGFMPWAQERIPAGTAWEGSAVAVATALAEWMAGSDMIALPPKAIRRLSEMAVRKVAGRVKVEFLALARAIIRESQGRRPARRTR